MAVKLSAVPTPDAPAPGKVPPLAPVVDPDTGEHAVITHAGVKLAVVARTPDATPDTYQLARYRPAREARAESPGVKAREARDAGWTPTSRLADIQRAMAGGLLA